MTYLELANTVLTLMRLDTLSTVAGVEDEAVKVVLQNINDAKRKVENSWRWNGLRDEWTIALTNGTLEYPLVGSTEQVIIDDVVLENSYPLVMTNKKMIDRKFAASSSAASSPLQYAVSGINPSREVLVKFWPEVNTNQNVVVSGWSTQADLAADNDVLVVPSYPVIYEALAMSARERGEVGGQTAIEIFGMAKKYLEDAIALDAAMSPLDVNWYTV